MDNSNVKKRKTLTFEEFLKNKVGIEKGDHKVVDDHYAGEKKGDAGVTTLDEPKKIKIVKEAYEMDLDGGDMGEEHAKAVIAEMFDMLRGEGEGLGEGSLQKALDKVCEDWGIELNNPEDDRKGMIISSIKSILGEIAGQAERLK